MIRNYRTTAGTGFSRRKRRRSQHTSQAHPQKVRRHARRRPSFSTQDTRRHLALIVTALVTIIALIAIPLPAAVGMFDKVAPLLTLVLGYYFGYRTG
jgi:hypothetical protein